MSQKEIEICSICGHELDESEEINGICWECDEEYSELDNQDYWEGYEDN